MELNKCKCGGEAEVIAHYSSVYERIHGFAECKQCGKRVWGKVSFNTIDVDTRAPDFPEWKRNAYAQVERSVVEAWNEEVA